MRTFVCRHFAKLEDANSVHKMKLLAFTKLPLW